MVTVSSGALGVARSSFQEQTGSFVGEPPSLPFVIRLTGKSI